MKKVLYVTGNAIKFQLGQTICRAQGLEMEQGMFDAPEIQDEDGEIVARDKAQKAFEHFQKPIVVCDDNWIIPALNGFPGPYMKSMNHWFTAQDWLRLTSTLDDRRIILRQIAVYQDANGQRAFTCDIEGILLREARGKSPYPHSEITSFDGGRTSNAEHHARGETSADHRQTVWHDFARWFTKERS